MLFFFFFSNELHLMNANATSMLQLLLPRSIASQTSSIIHTRLHNPLSITSSLPFRNQTVSHPRQCKSSSFKQCSSCFMFFPLNPFWCSNAAGFGFSHGALNSWIVEKQQKIKARLDGAFSVLDVYVLQELLPPFFIGLTAFTLLGLSFGVGPNVATILEKAGMRWCSILSCCQLIALRIPSYVTVALPMACVLAPMLAFGRMGFDNEILALRMFSLKSWRIIVPTFMLLFVASASHFLIAEGLAPLANQKAVEVLNSAQRHVKNQPLPSTQKVLARSAGYATHPVIYPEFGETGLQYLFYAHGIEGDELTNVTLLEIKVDFVEELSSKQTFLNSTSKEHILTALKVNRVIMADTAYWNSTQRNWVFKIGIEYVIQNCRQDMSHKTDARNKNLSTFEGLAERMTTSLDADNPCDFTLHSVLQFKEKCFSGMTCTFDDVLFLGLGKKVDNMRLSEISRLQRLMERNRNMKESRKLQEKLHQRFALPCACIIFGLVGTLTSLILPHDQKKTGFGLTLAIIFGYYMVSVFCSLVGQLGVISPSLGVWIPNLAGVGSVLVVSSWLDHHEP